MTSSPRHFLDISAVDSDALHGIMQSAHNLKAAADNTRPLEGKMLAMVFDKPSTRTRVSFDVGMRQLGGETILLSGAEMQLGRGETVADTARVLSRYVDAIMIRTTSHSRLLELAADHEREQHEQAHLRLGPLAHIGHRTGHQPVNSV